LFFVYATEKLDEQRYLSNTEMGLVGGTLEGILHEEVVF
jgi:hypothetical protein